MGNTLFKVSVIIPVYNAEKFLTEAVESAVHLSEVGEVILVEDGSPDNALIICNNLKSKYSKVKVFQHPKGVNRGAGISRNLGIRHASFEYISFLDADDVYLPNRFSKDVLIFRNSEIDGVYNCTGKYEAPEDLGLDAYNIQLNILPEDVLYNMLTGGVIFDTNGITLKKSIIERAGYFNDLKLHEDTHLWYKVAHFGKLQPGNFQTAVALTRNHSNRRIYSRSKASNVKFLLTVIHTFSKYKNPDKRFIRSVVNSYAWNKAQYKLEVILIILRLFFYYPSIFKNYIL
jgi:glycosyltransferase involved in cell wall biosynthesis